MKESPTDDLFELIKSMSRSEKRYFKLDAKKGSGNESNSYLKLFDTLNGMDEYDEARLYKKLKGEPLLDRLTTEKNYLYYAILKSMRNYWSDKSVYSRIKDMILNANYLLDRGLYEQSEKMLKKAKKLAKEYEQSASLLEINRLERSVYMNLQIRSLKSKFEELVEEKEESLNRVSQEMKFSDYKYLIFSKEFSKHKRIVEKNRIQAFKEEFPIEKTDEKTINSVHSFYEFYQSQAYYYRVLGDFDKAFLCKLKVIDWWEKNELFKKEYFHKYMGDLMNYVSLSYASKRLDLIPSVLNKIEKEKPATFHQERLVFTTLALSKMLFYLNKGMFEESQNFVKTIENKFNKYYIRKALKTSIYGNIAILYFILSEFETCIKWIDKIVEHKKNEQRQDVQRYIRVIKIICLFELDKLNEFENACRSTIRYIDATTPDKNRVFEYEVILGLKRIASLPLEGLNEGFDNFKQFLQRKKDDPRHTNAHGLDEYLFYINSKMSKISILEYIRKQS